MVWRRNRSDLYLMSVSLFSSLYIHLQAGRFTTQRLREGPISLVASLVLDSSVDPYLCPSVCICSFVFSHLPALGFSPPHSLSSFPLIHFIGCLPNPWKLPLNRKSGPHESFPPNATVHAHPSPNGCVHALGCAWAPKACAVACPPPPRPLHPHLPGPSAFLPSPHLFNFFLC